MENPWVTKKRVWNVGLLVAVLALYVWAWRGTELDWGQLTGSLPHVWDFLTRMFPPDWSVRGNAWTALAQTVQMALLGTTLAAVVSLPLGVLAARNLSPRGVSWATRGLLNLIRTVPSVVWGLLFVAAVGLGPVAGVLALTCYGVGYLAKYYYETFETMDERAAQALRLAGASRAQIFQYAILPQALPLLASYTLFILEYSIRAATILGVVGAGGVGFYLHVYLGQLDYPKAAALLLWLLVVVVALDWLSGRLRARLTELHGATPA